MWVLKFQHTLREENNFTDWFAKQGLTLQQPIIVLESCPNALHHYLLADVVGTLFVRLIVCSSFGFFPTSKKKYIEDQKIYIYTLKKIYCRF